MDQRNNSFSSSTKKKYALVPLKPKEAGESKKLDFWSEKKY